MLAMSRYLGRNIAISPAPYIGFSYVIYDTWLAVYRPVQYRRKADSILSVQNTCSVLATTARVGQH